MGIINRVLLFFYTIGIALLSLGAALFCLQVVPAAYVWNEFLYLSGRWETGAVALVMFLVSIQLFGLTFSSGKKTRYDKEAVVIHGAMGDVRIAIEAIKNLVDKTARSVHGVRDVKERVTAEVSKSSPAADPVVHIKLRVILGQENNAAAVSDEIQKKIREQLTNFVGLRDVDIEITVENIANTATAKQRVV